MKRKVYFGAFMLLITFICIMGSFYVYAAEKAQNWYCAHRSDHAQPLSAPEFDYISQYNGYYIDKKYGDKSDDKVIYLTFDVGYENGNVARVLDALKQEDVKGAFFVLGNVVKNNTDLINRMFNEGHLVCNHTYSHKDITKESAEELKCELERLENLCLEKTGNKISKYFRPPEGRFNEDSLKNLNDWGYKTVFWSFAYADWDNGKQMSNDSARKKIIENVHNGEVMLLHPTSKTNADILADVIRELKEEGYRFGTLDELCEQ